MRESRRSGRLFPLVLWGLIFATSALGCGGDDAAVKSPPPDCKLRPSLCAGEAGVDAAMDSAASPMDSGGMMDTGTSSDSSTPDAADSSVQDASDSGGQDSPSDGPGPG